MALKVVKSASHYTGGLVVVVVEVVAVEVVVVGVVVVEVEVEVVVVVVEVTQLTRCAETALDEIKLLKCVRETDENDALRERTGGEADLASLGGILQTSPQLCCWMISRSPG